MIILWLVLLQLLRLLSPKELGEYLSVPTSTIYKWNYEGSGPKPLRVGKHVRYRSEDVESWLDEQTHHPTSAA